jgi:hypothetical protein
MKCDRLAECPFFNESLSANTTMATVYIEFFCIENYSICARHMVLERREVVPRDLFPNDQVRAIRILRAS